MNPTCQDQRFSKLSMGSKAPPVTLYRAAQHQYEPRLERLQHAVESLGLTTTARPPRGSDEYLRDWKRYLADPRQRLTQRALGYLCWEPDVATASRFQDCLDQGVGELSTRMLQGLVRSCHVRWSQPLAAGGAVARYVEQRLETYRGSHQVLARWREHAEMLLGPQGHCIFAKSLLAARVPIKKHCEAWALEESSQYVLEAVRHAVHTCQEHLGRDAALRTYLLTTLLPWAEMVRAGFSYGCRHHDSPSLAARDLGLQEALTKLVLQDTRLGDPRLPRNMKNWLGIQEARQRLLQWLSRADINFLLRACAPQWHRPAWPEDFLVAVCVPCVDVTATPESRR